MKDQIEEAIDQLVEGREFRYTYDPGTYQISDKEQQVINNVKSMMLKNKLVTMQKTKEYVNAAVEILKKKNIPLTLMRLYNAALGQGGWSA